MTWVSGSGWRWEGGGREERRDKAAGTASSWNDPCCEWGGVMDVIHRPGVTAAVLQTALSIIHSLINWVRNPLPPNLQNIITLKPLEPTSWHLWKNVNPISCVMCHVWCVMRDVLCVMCYVLCVMCYVLCVMYYVLCLMSYILYLMSYVLCLMSYMSYVWCLSS